MPRLKIQVSWYWLLCVGVTTADKWCINTVRVRTLTPFFQRAALWTDSCVGGVESFIPHGGGKRWFWGGERCSASEALVLLKDTLQIKQAMGATCGHAGSRHPITAGPSTHTPSLSEPAGEPGVGLQISNYPSLTCALYGPSSFFLFLWNFVYLVSHSLLLERITFAALVHAFQSNKRKWTF